MTESFVTAVEVYRNGCVVTRRGKIHLVPGKQTVAITGISPDASKDTVRLSLTRDVQADNIQVTYLTTEKREEQLEELRRQSAMTENRIANRQKQIELWQQNADFSQKESLSIREMADYIENLPQRLEALQEEVEKLKKEKKDLTKQINEKGRELSRYILNADMTCQQEGDYPFEISYYASHAMWYPKYEIHADDEENNVLIRLRGCIRQSTGESWNDVSLKLYTGNPSVSGTIPQLFPVYLNFYVQPKARRNDMYTMGMMKTFAAAAPMAMEEDEAMYEAEDACEPVEVPVAAAIKTDGMMQYELEGSWNVNSDEEVTCELSRRKIDCRYHEITIPKQEDRVYLAAEVKTADIEDLLESEASIYNKGTFMGNAMISPNQTEENYDISLGADETVKVTRKQVRKHTSTVLLKGTRKTEYEYEIKVTSRKERDCSLTVYDQIPVSQEKTITVDAVNVSGGTVNDQTGEIKWDLTLSPGETRSLALAYNVSWPKDKQLNI